MFGVKLFTVNLLCSAFSFLCELGNRPPEIKTDGRGSASAWDSNPILTTNNGMVRGYLMSSSEGNFVYSFEGIPYAEPPINELRFQPPVPIKSWGNVLEARSLPSVCLQVNPSQFFRTVGQEDCLYLNIYTTKIPLPNSSSRSSSHNEGSSNSTKLPVVVWIHGGAFSFGYSGDYGPSYLLNKDIVLVTLNYRVGVLGFLSTGDSVCPGNNGLRDQALAIKWVHDNIEHFGGNKDRVTLMGQSAGGVSVHLQMMSQQSQNYFQAAISLSGNAFVHWAILSKSQASRITANLARLQGCPVGNSSLTLQCLAQQNPVFLVANQLNLMDWLPFPAILFGPVIEPISSSSFLTATPDELYSEDKVAKIPWITSTTSQEGYIILLFLKVLLRMGTLRTNWNQLAPLVLNYKYFVTDYPYEVTNEITQFYLKDKSPRDATLDDFSEIISDRYFTFGFEKGLRKHSKVSRTYGYIWKYKGKYNIANNIGIPTSKWGVGHGEDVFYIFNSSSSYPGFSLNDPEYALSKIIVNVLHNFFELRDPTYTNENGTQEALWTPVVSDGDGMHQEMEILQFDHDIKMIPDFYMSKVNFWLSLNLSDTTM